MRRLRPYRPRRQVPVNKSQCRCLADVVLLYIRYACPKLINQPQCQRLQEYAEYLYTELVRGEIVTNPKSCAAGILYVAVIMTKTYGVTQQDIAEIMCCNESTLRAGATQIKFKAEKQGLFT